VCVLSLVEIRLGDLEEGAVAHGLDGEHEWLPGEHSKLAHHLPRLGDKQTHRLLLVDHALVDVQTAGQDEM